MGQEKDILEVEVLGESVICSLDVDVYKAPEGHSYGSENRDAEGDASKGEVHKAIHVSECQYDTDMVLQRGAASNKVLVS